MKKIILAILIAIGALVIFSISCSICSSCISCMSCDSCGSCGSCGSCDDGGSSSGGGGGSYVPPQNKYCVIMRNYDAEDETQYPFNISYYSLDSSWMVREGYDFLGVYDQKDSGGMQYFSAQGERNVEINEGATLYMRWRAKTYTVELYIDGGFDGDYEMEFGRDITDILYTPESSNYNLEFKGWAIKTPNEQGILTETFVTDEECEPLHGYETVGSAFVPDENNVIKLYAVFGEHTCTVTFVFNTPGKDDEVKEVVYGSNITELPQPETLSGQEFKGWSYTNSTSSPIYYNNEPIYDDTTLYAIFLSSRTISVKTRDGSAIGTITVYNNDQAVNLSNWQTSENVSVEVENGYQISGWYSNQSMAGSTRLYNVRYIDTYSEVFADVTPIQYPITYELGPGETCSRQPSSYTIEGGVTLPTVTKANYDYVGWRESKDESSPVITTIEPGSTGAKTLYPVFKGADITLTLMSQNPSGSTTTTREYGKRFTLSVPVYNGYKFLGWYDSPTGGTMVCDDAGNSISELTYTEARTLYAHWATKYFVNITVDPAGVCVVDVNEYYLEGDRVELTLPAHTGYNFNGWYVGGECKETSETYRFDMPADDVDIEVKFTAKTYSVNFSASTDGIFDKTPVSVTYGQPFQLPVVYKVDYVFQCWTYNGVAITDNEGKGLNNWNIDDNNPVVEAVMVPDDGSNGKIIVDVNSLLAMKDAPGEKYTLVVDINMQGHTWEPFEFSGTLDGGNHTIRNLTVSSDKYPSLGMFTEITGTVQDLKLENLNVTSTYDDYVNFYNVGGVCGKLKGTLTNVTITSGKVDGSNARNRVGGLVGIMESGEIDGCENHAEVVSKCAGNDSDGTGGIVARSSSANIKNCTNYGKVTGGNYVGGVVGYMSVFSNNAAIRDLKNQGEITGKNNVGGVFGFMRNAGSIGNSSGTYEMNIAGFTNSATITGESRVGGIGGYIYVQLDHSNSWNSSSFKLNATSLTNTGDVTGTERVGGIFGEGHSNHSESFITAASSGKITASEYYLGGIAGRLETVKLINCSNAGTTINATGVHLDNTVYYGYIGGYVGWGYYINGCTNESAITYAKRGNYVGGIAGYANNAILNCTNTAAINASASSYVGGIVGNLGLGANGLEYRALNNSGNVTGVGYVGGICGNLEDVSNLGNNSGKYTMNIVNCTNSAAITGTQNYVGGLMGRIRVQLDHSNSWNSSSFALIANSLINTGDVSGVSYIGGIVGYCYTNDTSSVLTATSSGKITASEYYVGGIVGQAESIVLKECDNTGTTINATGVHLNGTTREGYIGGYAGRGYSFESCTNAANITYTMRGNYVGGIAGYANGTFTSCTNKGAIVAEGSNYVGGIAGYIGLGSTCTLEFLTNESRVTGSSYVGGIVGDLNAYNHIGNSSGSFVLTVRRFTNSGEITGKDHVGGLAGHMRAVSEHSNSWNSSSFRVDASYMYNTGNIRSSAEETPAYMGGLIGQFEANGVSTLMEYSQSGTVPEGDTCGQFVGAQSNLTMEE